MLAPLPPRSCSTSAFLWSRPRAAATPAATRGAPSALLLGLQDGPSRGSGARPRPRPSRGAGPPAAIPALQLRSSEPLNHGLEACDVRAELSLASGALDEAGAFLSREADADEIDDRLRNVGRTTGRVETPYGTELTAMARARRRVVGVGRRRRGGSCLGRPGASARAARSHRGRLEPARRPRLDAPVQIRVTSRGQPNTPDAKASSADWRALRAVVRLAGKV